MSKFAKDGNSFRREWDKEAFEKRAKERLEAELALEDERERKKTEPRAIVQRAPLQRRIEDLQLTKFVNRIIFNITVNSVFYFASGHWRVTCEVSI